MNTPTTTQPGLTREKAHAIIKRLLADSLETRRQMEETFHTDPDIQKTVQELKALRVKRQQADESL